MDVIHENISQIFEKLNASRGLPRWPSGKEPACQCRRCRFNPWVGKEMATHSSILALKIPWTRGLAGYSPWGHKESDTTEAT